MGVNGIGAYWFPRFVRNYLNRRFHYFVNAANMHDIRYRRKETSRLHIDIQFLRELTQESGDDYDVFIAFVFYLAVRLFGWISWRKT